MSFPLGSTSLVATTFYYYNVINCRKERARFSAWVRPFMGIGIGCKRPNLKTEKDFGRLNTISLCGRYVLLLSHGRVGYVHGARVCDVRGGYGSR